MLGDREGEANASNSDFVWAPVWRGGERFKTLFGVGNDLVGLEGQPWAFQRGRGKSVY